MPAPRPRRIVLVLGLRSVCLSKALGALPVADLAKARRWITLKPHGPDSPDYRRVMIEDHGDGTAHVVAGSKGKSELSGLRLTQLRSPEQVKEDRKQRDREQRAKEAARKADMTNEQVEAEKKAKAAKVQTVDAQRKQYVEKMAPALGIENWQFQEDKAGLPEQHWTDRRAELLQRGMSQAAAEKKVEEERKKTTTNFRKAHEREVLSTIKKKLAEVRQQFVDDPTLLHQAQGVTPLVATTDEVLDVTDIDPSKARATTPGYARDKEEQALQKAPPPEVKEARELAENGDAASADTLRDRFERISQQLLTSDSPHDQEYGEKLATWTAEDLATADPEHRPELAEKKMLEATAKMENAGLKAYRRSQMEHPEMAIMGEVALMNYREKMQKARDQGILGTVEVGDKQLSAQEAYEALRADKQMRLEAKEQGERLGDRKEKEETSQQGAYAMDFSEEQLDQAVVDELKAQEEAQRWETFFDQIKTAEQEAENLEGAPERINREHLAQYLSEGAFQALDEVGLTTVGQSMIDRSVPDALGTAAAAQLVAHAMRQHMDPEELKSATEGLADYHKGEQAERIAEAMREAQEQQDLAAEIAIEAANNPRDARLALELNQRRREHLLEARGALGRALGELETVAALNAALAGPEAKEITAMIDAPPGTALIESLRALGLSRGQYSIEAADGQTTVTINTDGMSALLSPVDKEIVEQARDMQAIKRGEHDEDGWLPEGIVSRPVTSFNDPDRVDMDFHEPLDFSSQGASDTGAMAKQVTDYATAEFNNGRTVEDIRNELLSAEFGVKHGVTPENAEAFLAAVDDVMPQILPHDYAWNATADLRGPDGKWTDPEAGQQAHDQALREGIQKNQELQEQVQRRLQDRSAAYAEKYHKEHGQQFIPALHDQAIDVDDSEVHEAAFRALAAHPMALIGFKPIGELDRKDTGALQEHFWKNFAYESLQEAQERLQTADGKNPQREWQKHLGKHDGVEGGYQAIQQHMRENPVSEGGGLFGGGPELHPLADVDLADTGALIDAVGHHIPDTNPTLLKEAIRDPHQKARIHDELQSVAQARMRDYFYTKVLGIPPGELAKIQAATGEAQGTAWERYVQSMGGRRQAYEALQADIRGQYAESFAKAHQQVTGKPLKAVETELPYRKRHARGVTKPGEKDATLAAEERQRRSDLAKVGTEKGKQGFQRGSRADRAEQYREGLRASGQRNLFAIGGSGDDSKPTTPARERHKRLTLGDRAEKQIAALLPHIGKNVNPKQKVDVFPGLRMHGDKIVQQRVIKGIERAKRMGGFLGVGSGKSLMTIGAFTHLHAQGKVKRGLFVTPSKVAGQFGSEISRFTEPGKYQAWANPGASKEERLNAYRDPANHMAVVTHQALRNDVIEQLGASGLLPGKPQGREAVETVFDGASREERAGWVKQLMDKEGWRFDMMTVDEGHDALNRQGKQNSTLANVMDAISDNTEYYVPLTANPLKNDPSEIHDWLSKIDPKRYPPTSRDEFMRRYGSNTVGARTALQRLVSPYFYSGKIDSGVTANRKVENVSLNEPQQADYDQVRDAYHAARAARSKGETDLEALKALAPDRFEGVPEEKHGELAEELHGSLGFLRDHAFRRVVNGHDQGAKLDRVADLASTYRDRGQPGVVFAHNLAAVDAISKRLRSEGHNVGVIDGRVNGADVEKVRQGFQPPPGTDPEHDILVLSDAAAIGINLQRGKWLANYDTPDTAKTHEQRQGRINRLGQTEDVTIHDLVTDTPLEQRARKRLETKYALGDIFQSSTEALDDTGMAHYIAQRRAQAPREMGRQEKLV